MLLIHWLGFWGFRSEAASRRPNGPQPSVDAMAAPPRETRALDVVCEQRTPVSLACPSAVKSAPLSDTPPGQRARALTRAQAKGGPPGPANAEAAKEPAGAPPEASIPMADAAPPSSNPRAMTPPVQATALKDTKRADAWKKLPVEQLTDADVLAMPDSEYMSEVQLSFFKRKLEKLKADMLSNAGETTEHLREDTVVVPDPADRATIEEEHALELRTRDRERKLLKKIEQAIARIDAGDYGYCEETGEPIGVGRLMARPTASLSLEAQQRRELKQKMFGD